MQGVDGTCRAQTIRGMVEHGPEASVAVAEDAELFGLVTCRVTS